MRILLLGSGAREHALLVALRRSSRVSALFVAPGNAGMESIASCVPLNIESNDAIVAFAQQERIDLVVGGSEAPLVNGVVDALAEVGIRAFGPRKKAAQLEGSKAFMKDIAQKYRVPTARFAHFTEMDAARAFARSLGLPVVIKTDGLAAGKGVIIAQSIAEADAAIESMISGRGFGDAGRTIVIEEFMEGEEVSVFALSDGTRALYFGSAQDHKRVGEGDTGPNTGGMGTYAPVPIFTDALRDQIMREIVQPTVDGMAVEGMPYHGVLFAGIMVTARGPKLLEYNIRFGDPETQVLMARLESDLLTHMLATLDGTLNMQEIRMKPDAAICVVMAARGYPGDYVRGTEIRGLAALAADPNLLVLHAGTKRSAEGAILANGGRVLGVTALGDTLRAAQARAYAAVDQIDWPEGFCRRDIGWRAMVSDQ